MANLVAVVVEDERTHRMLVSTRLRGLGFEVITAVDRTNFRIAIERCEAQGKRVALVVSDFFLQSEDGGGVEVLQDAGEIFPCPHRVLMSSHADSETVRGPADFYLGSSVPILAKHLGPTFLTKLDEEAKRATAA